MPHLEVTRSQRRKFLPVSSHILGASDRIAIPNAAIPLVCDLLTGSGDVTSARFFYEPAADAPDARAALRLGESYDPAFLAEARLSRPAGNIPLAAQMVSACWRTWRS